MGERDDRGSTVVNVSLPFAPTAEDGERVAEAMRRALEMGRVPRSLSDRQATLDALTAMARFADMQEVRLRRLEGLCAVLCLWAVGVSAWVLW